MMYASRDRVESQKMLISAHDAARALSISEKTLWTMTAEKRIPCVRIGRRVLYSPADLVTWIEQQKSVPMAGESCQ